AEFRRPMIDAVKAAGGFHVYLAPGTDGRFGAVLAELGLEGTTLGDAEAIATPAVIVLAPGEAAPEGLEDIAIRPPADAPPAALRELLRVALQNSVLKLDVRQLEEQARRQHRQFEELNRIGIALSAERDFDEQYGYHTKSMLTVPMHNYSNEIVGAVKLINAKRRYEVKLTVDTVEQEVVSFRPEDLEMIESIASQAAVAIDNKTLLDSIQA